MTRCCKPIASICLSIAVVCASGCGSVASRNLRESIQVTAGPSLAEADVRFILELREKREEVALADVEEFLAGGGRGQLSGSLRAELQNKRRKLDETLAEAIEQTGHGVILIKPNKDLPFADDNIVLYLEGGKGFRAYFSLDEIDQLFAHKKIADDLSTLQYTHPLFSTTVLEALRENMAKRNIETPNLAVAKRELHELKTLTAAAILERKLRELGIPLPDGVPVLASGTFGGSRSPKLTEALQDSASLERLVSCGEPEVVRALVYLIRRRVVDLDDL